MKRQIFVVIDTNVLVSSLITKNPNSPTVKVMRAVLSGAVTPLYHQDILDEYREVLSREKFRLQERNISSMIDFFKKIGVEVQPRQSGEILPDMDDLIFYEVALDGQGDSTFLVTGNIKHYPIKRFIVTPAELVEILFGAIDNA